MITTRFKIKFNNICKYIPKPESLEDLLLSINNTFGFKEEDLFSLSYKDEEEDSIIISDSMDFSNLIKYLEFQNKKTITIQISSQKENKKISTFNYLINKENKIDLLNKVQNIYNYIKNNITSPFQKDLSSNYLNKTLNLNTKNNNDSLIINLTLINDGKLDWPNPLFLICLKEKSLIFGKTIRIMNQILPSKTIDIKIKLDLSNIKNNGKYVSLWQLFDEKGNSFGNIFTININCIFDNELKIKPQFFEVYHMDNEIKTITSDEFLIKKGYKKNNEEIEKLVNEIKEESNCLYEDGEILNALVKCNKNKKMSLELLKYEKENNIRYHKY
jgi:hypothetical protein